MSIEELYRLFLRNPLISIDTRSACEGSLFFCLKGEHFNGNIFAQAAFDAGAAYVVIDDPAFAHLPRTILVGDSLHTLQQLALHHRNTLSIPVLGITGTNGKTTTKELIAGVLSKKLKVSATRGNLNNHIGVPLTLLAIDKSAEIAIVEMGANHPGEIGELCKLAKPGLGIITNVGKAHLEGFGSKETIIETKTDLYRSVSEANGKLFVNADDHILMLHAKDIDHLTYGTSIECFCKGKMASANPFVEIFWGNSLQHKVQTQLIGSYNFENVLAAACIGSYFGVPENDINDALAAYQPSNMRSQFKITANNRIVLDAYNANPTSMRAAIESFTMMEGAEKILILGDMFELGKGQDNEHKELLEYISVRSFKKVILVGPVFCRVNTYEEFFCLNNADEALNYLRSNTLKGAIILLKGSRGVHMEKILEAL